MRDGNNGENFTGLITAVGTTNGGQQDTVTIEVGKEYLQDFNKCNLSDQGGIINLGNQEFYYDSWSYSISYDGEGNPVYSYTFTLSDSELNGNRVTNDRVGKTANIGASISYQGIPYYMNQMNEWLRTFSQKFNDILTSGYDSNNNQGIPMFTGNMATSDEQFDFPDDKRYDTFTYEDFLQNGALTVDVSDDSYYRMKAENFSVLSAMENDPGLLANKYKEGDGVEQSDLLKDLKDMVYNKDKMSFRGCSASEFLQCVLADVALNTNRANTFYSSFTGIADTIENQRISISGVDEDEEAVNLVKYQNGYNLASKMIQTLTEIYDKLILETGV